MLISKDSNQTTYSFNPDKFEKFFKKGIQSNLTLVFSQFIYFGA